MWIDHLLFWTVLVWMLLLAVLVVFSVRALLRDDGLGEAPPDHRPPAEPDPSPTRPTSPPRS